MNYSFNEARPALEVFHTGDSVRAYDFLGAHLVNRNDKNGVVFRVWAPTARSVSVAGDFNNWNNEANYMYNIGYGVWEVFVEGVKEFCTYKYCIESEYGDRLMKADPYAFHAQTRPGQASVVYDIESYSWNDSECKTMFIPCMIGYGQLLIIVFVVILLFGGAKIPELMRGMCRGVREFKDAMNTDYSSENKKPNPADVSGDKPADK